MRTAYRDLCAIGLAWSSVSVNNARIEPEVFAILALWLALGISEHTHKKDVYSLVRTSGCWRKGVFRASARHGCP